MGCIRVFGTGKLTSHCRGPVHQAIYIWLSTSGLLPQYALSLLIAYSAHSGKDFVCSMTKTLDSSLWQTQQPYCLYVPFKAFSAMDTSATANLYICQHNYYVSEGYPYAIIVQLLARYHNLRMSIRTFKNQLLYVLLEYSAD